MDRRAVYCNFKDFLYTPTIKVAKVSFNHPLLDPSSLILSKKNMSFKGTFGCRKIRFKLIYLLQGESKGRLNVMVRTVSSNVVK